MQIYQQGLLNTTALTVAGVYPQIVPPSNQVINGVPSNALGYVGTASWGPVNSPQNIGDLQEYNAMFGPIMARKYDLGTLAAIADLLGADNLTCVRVTDGTDTAATITVQVAAVNAITFTSKYTGSYGSNTTVQLTPGSAANSWAVIVGMPGINPERFDNITGTGLALWQNIASAINNGQSGIRAPSQLIIATVGTATGAPTAGTSTLAGGTDGVTTITAATLVGVDTLPRKGMYALRSQINGGTACLADADDNTQWTYQAAFGAQEGVYMIGTSVSGDSITNCATNKASAGIDNAWFKLLLGDWCQIFDQTNNQYRYIPQSGFVAALRSIYGPEQSLLNKPINGVLGTQKSATGLNYTSADIAALVQAGIDVIANPAPGGNYWACQTGHNSSSNAAIRGDNYTSMTNYIATTIATASGPFVGQVQSPTLQAEFKGMLDTFFLNMQEQGQISDWQVQCDGNNNPQSRTAAGYMQADIQVVYFSIVEKLLVNIQGGQSVTITRVSTQPLAA